MAAASAIKKYDQLVKLGIKDVSHMRKNDQLYRVFLKQSGSRPFAEMTS